MIKLILAVLNVIQIFMFNFIYNIIAYKMTDFENHKTYSSYENSLASKIFIFQFVNSFNSLIIIAFLKRLIDFMGGCVKTLQFGQEVSTFNYCDEELEYQMITIALLNFFKNFSELGIPWLRNKYKTYTSKKKGNLEAHDEEKCDELESLRKNIEYQNNLNNFNKGFLDATFDDYLEITIQFGYVTLFAMSFPLLPIIAFLTNITENEVDKTKLLRLSKRPNPISVSTIGGWFYVFETISFLAIFFNVGILVFTSNNFYELELFWKWILFMFLVFFYIIFRLVGSKLIPDLPRIAYEMQRRHTFIVEKMCNGVLQEEDPQVKYQFDLTVITK